jgi:hypothetical protein
MSLLQAPPQRQRHFKIAEAARELYPVPVHPSAVVRHLTRGCKLRDGSKVYLAGTVTPGGWVVTREAVEAFFARLTADRLGAPAPRPASNARTEALLDAHGF